MSHGATILGIDGGGSKTLVALADRSGEVLRMVRGKGVNPMDNPAWRANLQGSLESFVGEAGLLGVAAALPVFGEVASLSRAQEDTVSAVFGVVPQQVLNDVDAAHLGAFAGGPGILILSGTGSMAWARDAEGRSFRVGGWGDQIGDEGSAYWIGLRILNLISQSMDGRAAPTAAVDAVFGQLGIDRGDPMNALEGWIAHLPHARSGIAGLAPLAGRLAAEGDTGGQQIIDAAADELARHVTAIARLSGLPLRWSYAGGTFGSVALREAVARRIGQAPEAPLLPPIGGALLCAARRLGWPTSEAWTRRLAESIEKQGAEKAREPQQRRN